MDSHPATKNVETIAQLRSSLRRGVDRHQRAVEAATRAVGRPRTVYTLLVVVLLWIGANSLAGRLGWPEWDPPPFFWLQGAVALYAALVTTMVLTTQNRERAAAEQRAELELQVNLLAEQKTTKIIALLEELRRDLPSVHDRSDPVAEAMQEEVDPKAVLAALESTMQPKPRRSRP
jgi:uncharacterized membrane protein